MDTVKSPAEQRIVLRNVSWETYERLLADHADSSAPRFTYDRGVLEIMILSARHERPNRALALLVEIVSEEMGLDVDALGSMTFRREDLDRGFEPDSCFYIQNADQVFGKAELDPAVDPPPDLVIEIDITSPSLNRFPIYAQFGVAEVWRYDGERASIFVIEDGGYVEVVRSKSLPLLTATDVSRFVEESKTTKRRAWIRKVREWARERSG